MKSSHTNAGRFKKNRPPAAAGSFSSTELLLLPDGRILVHNLTPAFAELLRQLNPEDDQIQPRLFPSTHQIPRA